jgi:hypothetical protein
MFKEEDLEDAFGCEHKTHHVLSKKFLATPIKIHDHKTACTYCCESTGARQNRGDRNNIELHFDRLIL